jgi:5-methylthioadenosine/S-adenosylhomocysteine deaminase
VIRGGTVVTVDDRLGNLTAADVVIDDGLIVSVGEAGDVRDAEVIDAAGGIVMPGFVDTHRHTWQAALRNIASDWTLGHYFTGLHFGFSPHFRPEDTYIGNLLGRLEALESGITTMLDWSHNLGTPAHADAAADALVEAGGRSIFAHGCGALHWQVPSSLAHDEDIRRLRNERFPSDDGLVTLALAARGPQFTPLDVAAHDFGLARELGLRITVHVGDGEWGKTKPIDALDGLGLLGPDVTYVHCNTIGDDELDRMAATGGTASVAPDVELQMGHGWPATGRLLRAGIRPSFSIDVCTSNGGDMFGTIRTAIGCQRGLDNAAAEAAGLNASSLDHLEITCRDVVEFATAQGAAACGLDSRIGSITPGKEADLIVLRGDALALTPLNNPEGAIVYNGHPGLVDTVIVAGRVVKRDGALVGVDLDRVRRLAVESRDFLFSEAIKNPRIADAAIGGSWRPAPYTSAEPAVSSATTVQPAARSSHA